VAVAKKPTTRPTRPTPADIDEQMRQVLYDIRLLEGTARVLQSRLDVVTAALSETLTAISTLEGAKGKTSETEALVPIGSGSFVRSKLADVDKVIIGVGAGVCIEKPLEDSMKDLRVRSSELERARTSVSQQLGQVLGQAEDYRAHLNDLAGKKGGGTVEIV
jgi:prefoldin alpha subunit